MSTGEYDYDIFVVGGGSGGVRAARMSAQAGAKVGICELPFDPVSSVSTGGFGGTCVIRGCVPKKLLVYGSSFRSEFEDAVGFGWDMPGQSTFTWERLLESKHKEITRLNSVYKKLLDGAGVEQVMGAGKVKGPHELEVTFLESGETTLVTAKNILIATGGRAVKPNIPGAEMGITSDEALALPKLPKRVAIVGGGYIAVEFAGIFNGLGAHVDIVYRQPLPLRGFDEEVRAVVGTNLASRGVNVLSSTSPTAVRRSDGGESFILDTDKGPVETDCVMFATGRRPNTDRPDLGLSAVGVELDKAGAVVVDEYSRTNVESIWAVGDVTNRMNLTPVAIMEGMAFMNTVAKGVPTKPDHTGVPSAVFCQPPVGTVGLSEDDAVKRGHTCDIYVATFTPMKLTLAGRPEKALMKLIVDTDTQRVLGVHMVGPDAAEIMQGMGVALKCGATKQQFDATVGIHPSSAEEFVTMRTPTRRVGPNGGEAKM